jgi:hypothetical protein
MMHHDAPNLRQNVQASVKTQLTLVRQGTTWAPENAALVGAPGSRMVTSCPAIGMAIVGIQKCHNETWYDASLYVV